MNTSLLLNVDLSILYRPSIYNDYREKKCMLEKKDERIPDLLQKKIIGPNLHAHPWIKSTCVH